MLLNTTLPQGLNMKLSQMQKNVSLPEGKTLQNIEMLLQPLFNVSAESPDI